MISKQLFLLAVFLTVLAVQGYDTTSDKAEAILDDMEKDIADLEEDNDSMEDENEDDEVEDEDEPQDNDDLIPKDHLRTEAAMVQDKKTTAEDDAAQSKADYKKFVGAYPEIQKMVQSGSVLNMEQVKKAFRAVLAKNSDYYAMKEQIPILEESLRKCKEKHTKQQEKLSKLANKLDKSQNEFRQSTVTVKTASDQHKKALDKMQDHLRVVKASTRKIHGLRSKVQSLNALISAYKKEIGNEGGIAWYLNGQLNNKPEDKSIKSDLKDASTLMSQAKTDVAKAEKERGPTFVKSEKWMQKRAAEKEKLDKARARAEVTGSTLRDAKQLRYKNELEFNHIQKKVKDQAERVQTTALTCKNVKKALLLYKKQIKETPAPQQ